GCGKGPGDGEGDGLGEEPQEGGKGKKGKPGPVPVGALGKVSKGVDPADQIGSGGGEPVVEGEMRGGSGWFNTFSAGSEGEVGSVGSSEMRFPQRVRARCLPSLRSVSPLCSVTFLFVQ